MRKPKTPAEFFAVLPPDQLVLAEQLRAAVLKALPQATQIVRSGWLFFESAGPVCFIQPHNRHINLGFWRGAVLSDPDLLLKGSGKHQRHIKIRSSADFTESSIASLVQAAAELNREDPYT